MDKNRQTKAPTRNFTNNVENRTIIVSTSFKLNDIEILFRFLSEDANYLIEQTNMRIPYRNLPYFSILPKKAALTTSNDIRGQLRSRSDIGFTLISPNDMSESYILDIYTNPNTEALVYSADGFDAKIVSRPTKLYIILADIFLDSAMFNSYSFLRNSDINSRRNFNANKLAFMKKHNLRPYLDTCDDDLKRLEYVSFAFCCRPNGTNNLKDFDYDLYIDIWNRFIKEYYPNELHKELPVTEQLDMHRDIGELPVTAIINSLTKKGPGAYIVLRVNRTMTENEAIINSIFGTQKNGQHKPYVIKDLDCFFNKDIQTIIEHLNVSAFKIIVPNY